MPRLVEIGKIPVYDPLYMVDKKFVSGKSLPPTLDVRALVKSYDQRQVLKGLDFQLHPGERVALMGPSGSGKSTLLNCLGGIDRPDSGQILLNGRDLTRMRQSELDLLRRNELTHIFQFFHLLPTLSARENIEFPLLLSGWESKRSRDRVDDLLDKTGLTHRADAPPSQLSGGEMQRVAIARALAPDPRLIFADEPTGNLDSKTGNAILDLIESLTAETGTTLLLVTHSQDATRICSRTLHLLDGQWVGADGITPVGADSRSS